MEDREMTVQELIDELMKIEDKSKEVIIDYIYTPVLDVIEEENKVVLYDY